MSSPRRRPAGRGGIKAAVVCVELAHHRLPDSPSRRFSWEMLRKAFREVERELYR